MNPGGSAREYTYDGKNNLLSERDELGKRAFYEYDAAGINLAKTARPLNGTDTYSAGAPQSNFAITSYAYYTVQEAQAQTGKEIHGLLKTVTDPEGGATAYTYDAYGHVATVSNPLSRTATYQYNKIGWLKMSTTPKGWSTRHYYDRNGNLLKTANPDGGTQRLAYDYRNNVKQRIMPTQYLASADMAAFDAENIQLGTAAPYAQAGHGYRYEYAANGTLTSTTDPLNFKTGYTYDLYGNRLTETKPNGAVYGYTYDAMDRLETATFKETQSAPSVTLAVYAYAILQSGNTTASSAQFLAASETAVTKTTYDYAGRPIRVDRPDGSSLSSAYNANGTLASTTDGNGGTTYYAYDGLNRQAGQWAPSGAGTYEYSVVRTHEIRGVVFGRQ